MNYVPSLSADLQTASPWGTVAQRAAQRRNKRSALLATAARLFKRQGFSGTALDAVAARLGVTKPTLYYYVGSKSELVHSCAMQGAQQALTALQKAQQQSGTLLAALQAYAKVVSGDFGWCMVRAGEAEMLPAQEQSWLAQRSLIEQALAPMLLQRDWATGVLHAVEGVAMATPAKQWPSLLQALSRGLAPAAAPLAAPPTGTMAASHSAAAANQAGCVVPHGWVETEVPDTSTEAPQSHTAVEVGDVPAQGSDAADRAVNAYPGAPLYEALVDMPDALSVGSTQGLSPSALCLSEVEAMPLPAALRQAAKVKRNQQRRTPSVVALDQISLF